QQEKITEQDGVQRQEGTEHAGQHGVHQCRKVRGLAEEVISGDASVQQDGLPKNDKRSQHGVHSRIQQQIIGKGSSLGGGGMQSNGHPQQKGDQQQESDVIYVVIAECRNDHAD